VREPKNRQAIDGSEETASGSPASAAFSGGAVVDEHFQPTSGVDIEAYLASGDLTAIHHITRYRWAREVLQDLPSATSVLDLGCGSGYGTFLLAQSQPRSNFLGIDYDPQAVAAAQKSYSLPNLAFRTGDPTDWRATIGGVVFEVVTCFDVLEHVQHRELMLENLVHHLRPDGWVLLSTPCGHASNVLRPEWEHHRIEYSAASLYDLLRRYFAVVRRPEDPLFPARAVFEELHSRGVDYLLHLNPVLMSAPIRIDNPYRS
jgi:2-polyprenyl-3-methyl-5-hydroxy-6-metoxy-1,4-benzoquinol methylase